MLSSKKYTLWGSEMQPDESQNREKNICYTYKLDYSKILRARVFSYSNFNFRAVLLS
jgi:hypothetical protein